MPDPKQILNGEVKYSLEDFYKELKEDWMKTGFPKEMTDKQKEEAFKSLFMFLLLSGEDKPMDIMLRVYNWPEKRIKEMQEAFEKEIDIVRHIHMRKYLDLYKEYLGGMSMTLKMLNLWIQDFLGRYIKEEKNGNS